LVSQEDARPSSPHAGVQSPIHELTERLAQSLETAAALVTTLEAGARRLTPVSFFVGERWEELAPFHVDAAPGGDLSSQRWFSCGDQFAARYASFPRAAAAGFRAYAAVPVRSRSGRILGQLAVLDDRRRRLGPNQRAVLEAYALAAREEIGRTGHDGTLLDGRISPADLLAALPDPALILDATGRLLGANATGRQTFGLGQTDVGSFIPWLGQDSPALSALAAAFARSGPVPGERVRVRVPESCGNPLEIELARISLSRGRPPATLVVARESETAFESSAERRSSSILDSIPAAVFSYTGRPFEPPSVHSLSRGARELLGPERARAVAAGQSTRAWIHPDDLEDFDRASDGALRNLSVFDHEYRLQQEDGSYRWVRALSRPVRSDASEVEWQGAIFDIGKQKERERRWQTMLDELPGLPFLIIHRSEGESGLWFARRDPPTSSRDEMAEYERFWNAIHPADREALERDADRARRTGSPLVACFRYTSEGGAARSAKLVARVIASGANETHWTGLLLDPAPSFQLPDGLSEALEGLSGVVFTYLVDAKGRPSWSFLSPRLAEVVGREGARRVRAGFKQAFGIVHPDDRTMIGRSWLASVRQGQVLDVAFRIQTDIATDRRLRWISHPSASESGGTIWSGVVVDVTDGGAAETQFRELAEGIPGLAYSYVARADGTRELVFSSGGFETLLGRKTAQGIDGELERFFSEVVHPDDRLRVRTRSRLAARALESYEDEYRVVTDEGVRWIRATARPAPSIAGNVLWHVLLLEVTKRREAEELLRAHAADLVAANDMLHLERSVSEEARRSKEQRVERLEALVLAHVDRVHAWSHELERAQWTEERRRSLHQELLRVVDDLLAGIGRGVIVEGRFPQAASGEQ